MNDRTLSDLQEIAWNHPCVTAEQTYDERFHKDIRFGGLWLSTHLTLNFGME